LKKDVILNPLLNLRPYHQCYTILGLPQNVAKYQLKTIFFLAHIRQITYNISLRFLWRSQTQRSEVKQSLLSETAFLCCCNRGAADKYLDGHDFTGESGSHLHK
jgi:hypothetical protein